jgi:hypothetical protein
MAETVVIVRAQSPVFGRQSENIRRKSSYLSLNFRTASVVGDDQLEIRVSGIPPKTLHGLLQKVKAFVRDE